MVDVELDQAPIALLHPHTVVLLASLLTNQSTPLSRICAIKHTGRHPHNPTLSWLARNPRRSAGLCSSAVWILKTGREEHLCCCTQESSCNSRRPWSLRTRGHRYSRRNREGGSLGRPLLQMWTVNNFHCYIGLSGGRSWTGRCHSCSSLLISRCIYRSIKNSRKIHIHILNSSVFCNEDDDADNERDVSEDEQDTHHERQAHRIGLLVFPLCGIKLHSCVY